MMDYAQSTMKLIAVPAEEFVVRFRGWKLPRELGEEIGPDRHGVNPFTKEKVIFRGSRSPVGPEPVADRDAIHHPRVRGIRALCQRAQPNAVVFLWGTR